MPYPIISTLRNSLKRVYFRLIYTFAGFKSQVLRILFKQVIGRIPPEGARWGSFASLYHELDQKQIFFLEQAIRYRTLGYYATAHFLDDNFLAGSNCPLVIVIERAGIFDMEAKFEAYVECLETALKAAQELRTQDLTVSYLIRLKIASGKVWTEGTLRRALGEARAFRNWVVEMKMEDAAENYSDVMVACMREYRNIIHYTQNFSNWAIASVDGNLPITDEGTRAASTTRMRRSLQKRNNFVDCSVFVSPEAGSYENTQALMPYEEFFRTDWCGADKELIASRLSFVRLRYAEALFEVGQDNEARVQISKSKAFIYRNPRLSLLRAYTLEQFQPSETGMQHVQNFQKLARQAADLGDGVIQQMCLREAHIAAQKLWSDKNGIQEICDGRDNVVNCLMEYRLHRNCLLQCLSFALQGNVIDAAICLGNLGLGTGEGWNAAEWLEHYDAFRRKWPNFDVPDLVHILNTKAAAAAEALGNKIQSATYLSLAHEALPNCRGVRQLQNGELDATTAVGQNILNVAANTQGPDHMHRAQKLEVAKTVIGLIRKEISCGEMSESKARNLFHDFAATSISFDEWIAIIDPYLVVGILFGVERPLDPKVWDSWFSNVSNWLQTNTTSSPILERHKLLMKIAEARKYMWNEYRQQRASTGEPYSLAWLEEDYHEQKRILDLTLSIDPRVSSVRDLLDRKLDLASQAIFRYWAGIKVDDADLADYERLLRQSSQYYRQRERYSALFFNMNSIIAVGMARLDAYKSVTTASVFRDFQEADDVFHRLSGQAYLLQALEKLTAAVATAERLTVDNLYERGVNVSIWAVRDWYGKYENWRLQNLEWIQNIYFKRQQKKQTLSGAVPLWVYESIFAQNRQLEEQKARIWGEYQEILTFFVNWSQKMKGRALLSSIGKVSELPYPLWTLGMIDFNSRRLIQRYNGLMERFQRNDDIVNRMKVYDELRRLWDEAEQKGATAPMFGLMRGRAATSDQLIAMCGAFNEDVVFVDWFHATNLHGPGDIAMAVYINGCFQCFLQTDVKLAEVEAWVKGNLDSRIRDPFEAARHTPLTDITATQRLFKMNGLLKGLKEVTRPGQLLVFCPTLALHRLPLHALLLGDEPCIVRNPVVYCQSLTLLRKCILDRMCLDQKDWTKDTNRLPVVFNALHRNPETSVSVVELASILKTTMVEVRDDPKRQFSEGIQNASLIHFHGHARFDEGKPLQHHLELSQADLDEEGDEMELAESEKLSAQEIFGMRFPMGAHITVMSCKSAMSHVTKVNEQLGLSAALHCAGADSIASSLWNIHRDIAVRFSKLFYQHLKAQRPQYFHLPPHRRPHLESPYVDMARAMQHAIVQIRKSESGETLAPYWWAGLVLHGFWALPHAWLPQEAEEAANRAL